MADSTLKGKIARAERATAAASAHLSKLIAECKHSKTKTKYDAAICEDCGKDLGWACGASPSKVCEFNGTYCIHCGDPSDRC